MDEDKLRQACKLENIENHHVENTQGTKRVISKYLELSLKRLRKRAAGRLEDTIMNLVCVASDPNEKMYKNENMDTAWHKGHVGTKGIKPSGRVETKIAASHCVFALNLAPAAVELGEPDVGSAHQVNTDCCNRDGEV